MENNNKKRFFSGELFCLDNRIMFFDAGIPCISIVNEYDHLRSEYYCSVETGDDGITLSGYYLQQSVTLYINFEDIHFLTEVKERMRIMREELMREERKNNRKGGKNG